VELKLNLGAAGSARAALIALVVVLMDADWPSEPETGVIRRLRQAALAGAEPVNGFETVSLHNY
jgi:hypothetical protein